MDSVSVGSVCVATVGITTVLESSGNTAEGDAVGSDTDSVVGEAVLADVETTDPLGLLVSVGGTVVNGTVSVQFLPVKLSVQLHV